MFGVVSPQELFISNFETEGGTSNRLNRLMRQKENGLTMEEIRELDTIVDKAVDEDFEQGYNKFLKDYKDEIAKLSSSEKTQIRENAKIVKAERKTMHKGIIKPVRPVSAPPPGLERKKPIIIKPVTEVENTPKPKSQRKRIEKTEKGSLIYRNQRRQKYKATRK